MVILVAFLQASQNGNGTQFVRLVNHHFLESAFQSLIFLEILLILVESCGTYGTQFTTSQCRLEDVCCIHSALSLSGAHQGVDFIDEQDNLAFGLDYLVDHRFQSFLKLTFILGTSHQRAHIERIHLFALQVLRHITAHDTLGKSLGNCSLTYTRLTDKHRVVLCAPAKNLEHTTNLLVTAYYRVELALAAALVKVD